MKKFSVKWWIILFVVMLMAPIFATFNLSGAGEAIAFEPEVEASYSAESVNLITGDFKQMKVKSVDDAFAVLDSVKDKFFISSSRESFMLDKVVSSPAGKAYRFHQVVNGTRIYGAQIVVSVSKKFEVNSITGTFYFDLNLDETVNYSKEDAKESLQEKYNLSQIEFKEAVWLKDENSTYINYIFSVASLSETSTIFVSARNLAETRNFSSGNGLLASSYPTAGYSHESAQTTQTDYAGEEVDLTVDHYTSNRDSYYLLADSSKNIYVTDGEHNDNYSYKYIISYNADGSFDYPVAVQALVNLVKCYDFYANEENFGVSIEGLKDSRGRSLKLIAIVHYGVDYENAAFVSGFGTEAYFIFGDGRTGSSKSFVTGLDIVGHEYQHAITGSVVTLADENAPGAINEAFSDIFGAAIEGHDISSPDFWRMGEDLLVSSSASAYRDMSAPWAYENCASTYDNLYPFCTKNHNHASGRCDYGGVHYNCTLLTYATYIMYSLNPDWFNVHNILSLWYQTLTLIGEDESFIGFANKMVQAGKDLGWHENEINTIERAYATVKIPGFEGEETWGGYYLTNLQGAGTVAKPYLINDIVDLATVAYNVNNSEDDYFRNARYKLNASIDLRNIPWVPIGTSEKPFNGSFNGGSNTISGLDLSLSETDFNGFFGVCGEDAYIYNLNVAAGQTQSTSDYTGAIVGKLLGGISSCSSALAISGKNVGGLVGLVQNNFGGSVMASCYATGNLSGDIVGGLISRFVTTSSNSDSIYKSGSISASYSNNRLVGDTVGGIVGEANGIMLVNNFVAGELVGNSASSVLAGFVGKLAFRNLLSVSDYITPPVSNMFLSCFFVGRTTHADFNYIYNEFISSTSSSKLGLNIIEKCVYKNIGNYKLFENFDKVDVVERNNRQSGDELFSGDFDFDNANYFLSDSFTFLADATSFEKTTYKFTNGKLPEFVDASFWLDNYSYDFDGGDGSALHPYEINTSEQLSYLSVLLTSNLYSQYYNKNYILTADIDLAGRIWTGIGYSVQQIEEYDGTRYLTGLEDYPFAGVFDGNGHTIFNMTSVEVMSIGTIDDYGHEYLLYDFAPSLFGYVAKVYGSNNVVIKNLTIEEPCLIGSVVGALAANVADGVTIENVSVIGGNIASSSIAGGLIGELGGKSELIFDDVETTIKNCYVDTSLSGRVVGGVVGYANDADATTKSTLNVINFLLMGDIRVVGDNVQRLDGKYINAIAGGIVGVSLITTLNVINSILVENMISYAPGSAMLGGFVGAIGQKSSVVFIMNITLDGNKLLTNVENIFTAVNTSNMSLGLAIGTIYSNFNGRVRLDLVRGTNHTNSDAPSVDETQNSGSCMISSAFERDTSNAFDENSPYDFYNENYYKNTSYFNADYLWEEEQTDRMFIVVTFRDYDGSIIGSPIKLKRGESLSAANIPTPSRASTVALNYAFAGWDKDIESIERSTSVFATYTSTLREYTVHYVDEAGNSIADKVLTYGSDIDQDVEAPQKAGNFFVSYKFVRWGKKGQLVTGEITIKPEYTGKISGGAIALIAFAALVTLAVVIGLILSKKHKVKRRFKG